MSVGRFTKSALFVLFVAASFSLAADDERDERDEAVSMRKVPVPVKAAMLTEILREVDGLRVEEVEREKKGGRVIYEVELEYRHKDITLEITAEGRLLSKKVERDYDDD